MKNYIIKKNCAGHQVGDVIPMNEDTARAYGPEFLEEQSSDNTAKQNDEAPANTNETPEDETAVNVVTDATGENQSEADNSVNEPNLEEMSYQDLKTLAASKGLEFAQNISTVKLIALIKGK